EVERDDRGKGRSKERGKGQGAGGPSTERRGSRMIRRRIVEEPTSLLAIWARRAALFALVTTVLAVLIVRSDILEPVPALSTFGGALLVAVLGMLLALGAFVVIWKDGIR